MFPIDVLRFSEFRIIMPRNKSLSLSIRRLLTYYRRRCAKNDTSGDTLYDRLTPDEIIWTGLLECISKIVTMDIFGIIW
jgi:hypothetical protein